MSSKRLEVRKKIVEKYLGNPDMSYRRIAVEVGTSVDTVRYTLNKIKQHQAITDKPRTGRPKGSIDKEVEARVLRSIENNPSASVRDLAKKFGVSPSTVHRMKHRTGLKTFRKQKKPKRTEEQQQRAIRKARELYKWWNERSSKCLVMDDESYFKYDFFSLPGTQFYSGTGRLEVPEEERTISVAKFGPKILVWQAICQCGLRTRPFFAEATISGKIYVEKCLKQRLLPFLKNHESGTIFWPDLATSHYCKEARDWYTANQVDIVPKNMNPPNVPELRPIERYWALIKNILRKEGQTAETMEEFIKLWIAGSRKVKRETVQKLMARVKRKLRLFKNKRIYDE